MDDETLNPDDPCAVCGMPRDCHWGRSPVAGGRCSGFRSKLRESESDLLEALRDIGGLAQMGDCDDLSECKAALSDIAERVHSVLEKVRK